jgi:thymidylate synthase
MNTLDKQYQDLLATILEHGVTKKDRTGTGTTSIFGYTIRHNMKQGFPLLTTKKIHFKSVVTELLWFLQGRTDLKWLLDNGNTIWVGDAYKHFTNEVNYIIDGYRSGDILGTQPHIEALFSNTNELIPLTKEEFINKIKTDDEFAKKWGSLGKIYGHQWRSWGERRHDSIDNEYVIGIDQIQNLINKLKNNPDDRRMMVTAWNPSEVESCVLPPCHYGFQVYTRELTWEEQVQWVMKNTNVEWENLYIVEEIAKPSTPTRAISLMWNQRSVDTPLGLPFNIASYGLLLEIIAKIVNMVPDELIGNLGDTHIYSNQIDGCKEQLTREVFDLPTLVHSKTDDFWRSFDVSLFGHLDTNDFRVENYKSGDTIHFPLSN